MQGSMTTKRRTIRIAGILLGAALGMSAALPLTAQAGPLLSGYGGPGQGNQAILGSTLLGGPGGGSAGGGGASGGGAQGSGSSAAASTLAAAGTTAGASHSSRALHAGSATHAAPQRGVAGELAASSYPASEPAATSSGSAFGLSGSDLAYILLGAAALAFTGALTRRVARTRTAKGHG